MLDKGRIDSTGVLELVTFHGQVSDAERDRLLDEAWLLLAPSVKEGWGIAIMEAAARAVPAVGYRSAGGVTESISPDDESASALGVNLMDGARLLDAAEAGLRQGKREADRLRDFWTG